MKRFVVITLKGFAYLLALLLLLLLVYSAWVSIAYRDLEVEALRGTYPSPQLETVEVDGAQLYYQDEGENDAPVILLLHSHYFTMRMWDDWIAPLSQTHRVIRFDMTSHGLTGPDPRNDYSMERSQQLLHGLLAHLQVENLTLVGSSLGGNFAFTFAAENPNRVDALVLMNSGGLRRKNARSGTIPMWVNPIFYLLPRMAYRAMLEWMIADDTLVTDALVGEFHDMFRRDGNRVAELNRMRSFDIGEPETTLANVTAPVLVMWGEENPQLDSVLAEEFKRKLIHAPKVDIKVYPGVGHVIPLEIPQQGSADLLAFLQTLAITTKAKHE